MTDVSKRIAASESERLQRRAAGWLNARGLVAGDRVAVDCDGSASYVAVVLAALRRGIIAVPLPRTLPDHDRAQVVRSADVRLHVNSNDWRALAGAPPTELSPVPLCRPMMFTSGTTGHRKGVWSGVWSEETAFAAYRDERDQWKFRSDDVHLVCSPLYHSAPLRFVMHTLLAGGDIVLQPSFDPDQTTRLLLTGDVTTSFMAPAHLQRISTHAAPSPPRRLRWLAHAGSSCPEALKRRVLEWIGPERLWEFYGSTEAQFTACRGDDWLDHPGTVGKARLGRTLSIDDDATVWCAQPPFARFKYWNAPEKTRLAWRGISCSVGDLGRLDRNGWLYLLGRRDDLIISGGVNVYPAEVERVMNGCDGVDACAVFPIEDSEWGQIVACAFVGTAKEASLRTHAGNLLPPASRPKRYVRMHEMPVDALGKVTRSSLIERYAN